MRFDVSKLSATEFYALTTALAQYVDNTRESVECADEPDAREAAELAAAEDMLEELEAHLVALADADRRADERAPAVRSRA